MEANNKRRWADVMFGLNLVAVILLGILLTVALMKDYRGSKGSGYSYMAAAYAFFCISALLNIADVVALSMGWIECARARPKTETWKNFGKRKNVVE